MTGELVQEGDVPGTPRNKPLLSATAQIAVKFIGAVIRGLPPTLGRARIQHPFHHN